MSVNHHPPDPDQRPRYRRDKVTAVVFGWAALASVMVAYSVTVDTVQMPDATTGTWVFVGIFDALALVVVVTSLHGLIRGVRVR